MSDLNIDFTGNDAQIQRIMQRLEEQNAKLILQNRMLAAESRQSSREIQSVFREQAEGLVSTAVQFFTIERGISMVARAYGDWEQRLRSLGKASIELNQNLTRDIAGAGDLPQAAAVEEFIEGQKLGTREQARQAYSGVSGAAHSSLDDRLALTREAVRAATLTGDMRAHGQLLGELRDLLPNYKPEDISDLSLSLRERAKADADKLTSDSFLRSLESLMRSGALKSPEQGFALGLSAVDAKLKPEIVEQIASAVSGSYDFKRPTPGRLFSQEDRAFNRFAGADAEQRLQMLLTDRTVATAMLGREAGNRLGAIRPEDVSRIAAELKADIARDFTGDQLRAIGRTAGGQNVAAEQEALVAADQAQRTLEPRGRDINRAEEFWNTQADKQQLGWFQRMLERAEFEGNYFTGNMFGRHRAADWAIYKEDFIPDEEKLKFFRSEIERRGVEGDAESVSNLEDLIRRINGEPEPPSGMPSVGPDGRRNSPWNSSAAIGLNRGALLPRDSQMDEQNTILRSIDRKLSPAARSMPVINAHTETR